MAADLQPSHNHNIPVLLNLDNSLTVSLETFPAILTKQMNLGASDPREKNLSLEDLCKAANSDLLASKSKGEDTKSGLSASSNIQMQKSAITGFISNIGLTVNEDVLTEPKQSQIILKDKQSDKYKCEYCGKICAKPSILQKHIRAHTNERPYPCEECGVQFKTKSNLYKHCKSRSHLILSAQITIQKDAGDKIVEKIPSPTCMSSDNNIQENTSSSWDGQEDINTRPQSSVFFLNQFGNGQVIFKSLGHVGELNVASLNSSNTVLSVSQKNFSECSPDSHISQSSSQRPFLKSFSEKGQSKTVHHVKPHSHSFSNEMDLNQIPKLDKTMTSDDIQKRISMIITLNDHIIDTPKEIKNHRFRKFVRDSDYGNVSMDSCNGKLVTRSNSITPTLSSDSFLSFTLTSSSVGSKSPANHHSNFLAAPTNEHIWSFVTNKSSSDNRSTLSTQRIQQFSLPDIGSHDANEFRNFTKAHSFGSSQSTLVSRSDSSLRALSVSSDPNVLRFCSRIPLEISISKNVCDYDPSHLSSHSIDVNPSLSPAVSPSSSPTHSSDQRLKLKRGRPKGSKNKLKSPVCSTTCAQPIVPTIHITSPDDNPPESHCRKELKRLLLMKRSMSNENSSDKNHLVPVPITSTSQVSQTTAVSTTLASCTGIKHLSPSSIPIKKRRKTLTELGRGTAFGTTVDDHNLELGASSKAKNNITKPLWSSDGSFGKSTLLDDIRAQESLGNLQCNTTNTANKSNPKISENTTLLDLTESNSKLQICLVDTSAHFSCRSNDLASNLPKISNSEGKSSFVTFANVPPQTCDSTLLPLELKEGCVLIPTHLINQAVTLDDNENKALECSLKTSALHLPSSSLNHKVGFYSVAATNNVHEVMDTKNMMCLGGRCLNMNPAESSTQQEMDCNTEDKLKHTTNIMNLKFKGCSLQRQTYNVKTVASSSELLDHCTSNLISTEFSARSRVDVSLSSNNSLDDCLLRAQMDSEAAASLLDLSKSRRPPSTQDEISMEMSVSHANTNSLIEMPRSTTAFLLQTSEKAGHDDHFFSSSGSAIKNYNFVEGKHVCPICQKTFPKEHSLSLHKNVHYMEKPYRCGKCQATFQSNWLLKRHQNIVHHLSKSLYDPRPFKCLECKVAFRTRGHLAKHARSKVHSEKIKSKSAKCIFDEDERESYDYIETSSGTNMPSYTPASIQDSFVHNSSMNSGTNQASSEAVSNLYNCDGHQDQFRNQASSPVSTLHKLKQNIEPRSLTLNDLAINEAILEFHTDENSISQISEAKPKKLSLIGKSKCCDIDQMGSETILNHTGPKGDIDNVSKSLSQKDLKQQDCLTSLTMSNSDTSSVKDCLMFSCRICSTACEDPLSLLNHYESHLEQRVHICLICDAGFKTQESLNDHLNLHCEKHSLGIQTQENEILGDFLRKCNSSLKIPMMVSSHPQDSPRVLPYLGNPAKCLSTVGRGRTFLQLPQSNFSSIVPCLSQKCIMSSGQWATQQSSLHLPANPIQQETKLQHLETEVINDTFPKLSQLVTNEGLPVTNPAAHLLLQPVSIGNISLFPQNTYLLVPSEANKGETSPNPQEVLFFDPSAGCFFAVSGRSLIGSATPVTKSLSSLAIPIESHNSIKPV